MDVQVLNKKICKVFETLDDKRYPETTEYIEDWLDLPNEVRDDAYGVFVAFAESDKPKEWTPEIIQFLEDLLLSEIEEENADAMNDLGAMYYDGNRGFEQSFEKAMKYYNMAAANGNRQSQENLGYCYYYGRDGEVDYEKAFHYFALGAFDGHLISLYKIGDMYYNGYYVEKNHKEALLIYERCMETMTEEAASVVAGPVLLRLGNMHLNGEGTKKDPRTALACYQSAERYLYSMVVDDGNYMYKKSLKGAIEGQEKARAEMAKMVDGKEWTFE